MVIEETQPRLYQ